MQGDYFAFGADVVRSRGILLDTLHALDAHKQSLTVVGAHAVYERTKHLTNEIEMDSTRDADIGVFPELLAASPLLGTIMDSLDLEPASPARPGVWGLKSERGRDLHERLTVDLIAPDAIAGKGSRSADTGVHGTKIVSRTKGTELTLIDRDLMYLDSFGSGTPIDAYVAGHAALIAAKSWKLIDRLEEKELSRNRNRLRPKDAGDLWRLIATSDGNEVLKVFDVGIADSRIGDAVAHAKRHVITVITPEGPFVPLVKSHFDGRFSDERIQTEIERWSEGFLNEVGGATELPHIAE
ncbi:hypothetical protein [Planctomonas psychrotolerans]|uniref:hypothetical protein n=1 Tax=Planctomonas psychrotolerans TaxID=2528712 RepID=UPI00123A88B0|nr:hypothetical protein [Planctomonas psychrotolerans]